MIQDLKNKRQIWELSDYNYYPSIDCFVISKVTIDSLNNNDILYWKTKWFIKVSTVKTFWEEKEEWKIFILRNFFLKELCDVDVNNELYFLKAKEIRDERNRDRDGFFKTYKNAEWQRSNITKDVEWIQMKNDRVNEAVRSLTPWELLIVTRTNDWWIFRWKWSLWIPNWQGKWVNNTWIVFGWEFVDWIPNWEWYVKFSDWEIHNWTWSNSSMKINRGEWIVNIQIHDLNYDNLTEKLVIQKHQDWSISVYED